MAIRNLLIANRGEIAVRVIRAARELGIRTLLAASDPDRNSRAAGMADVVLPLPGSTATETYLDAESILRLAIQHGADAVHPGYGFLSERADFADQCEAAGVRFVGPPGSAMRRLGSKRDAKELALACGVPTVPGYFAPGASDADLLDAADRLGYPVMLKATAGGGGRGIRPARSRAELTELLPVARQEARQGFGDDEMLVEKLVQRPRHVEIQILADEYGTVLSIGERECSVQRRRQKVLEESPFPLPGAPIAALEEAAVRLAEASGYRNAGTCEFLLDSKTGEFFFLEVNARLQVEHPVTEEVTGWDLVHWQLAIAAGERLPESPPSRRGHAIEARILAENPDRGFAPSLGRLLAWAEPQGPGIRVDSGFRAGDEITPHYDSMLAKLIVRGEHRSQALARMEAALLDFHVLGVGTNIGYLLRILRDEEYRQGEVHTHWLEEKLFPDDPQVPQELGAIVQASGTEAASAEAVSRSGAWDRSDGFRNAR
jgi:acetyl/propionyl-CoA carboxylase alpha subunit